jgi:ABC-type branched-subunit amino acid transport system substrate-binding protein
MMGKPINRRKLVAMALTALLAACQVIPKSTGPAAPAPPPPEGNLPADEGRHRVALLVPMSGQNAAVGQSIANATTMALLDTNASNLRITTYDTATGAAAAASRAMADGNKLVLGPLLGDDTDAIVKVTRQKEVPLISFSNDVTTASRDVFVMGHIPGQSINRTVAFARGKGFSRFGAIIPNGEYGDRAQAALLDAVKSTGGTLVSIEKYDRGNTSITAAAQRLREKGGFDSVLIADGARLSGLAAGQFVKATQKPKFLGTELWSGEAGIAATPALKGAWFSAVSDERFRQFVSSYKSRFGTQPHRIATLGYDAVLLTLRVAREWKPGKNFPTARLIDTGGFLGLDGPFRFSSNGVVERAMEVREVGSNTISVVSPAPTRFQD